MKFKKTAIDGLWHVVLEPYQDDRGSFTRLFCSREFVQNGLPGDWAQFNLSRNFHQGTLRGLHFMNLDVREYKIVRCQKGRIYDVVADLRFCSATFRHWLSFELNEQVDEMLVIPPGCAHGFMTVCDSCEVFYGHSAFYQAELDLGIRFDDPALNVAWPLPVRHISARDQSLPFLQDIIPSKDT